MKTSENNLLLMKFACCILSLLKALTPHLGHRYNTMRSHVFAFILGFTPQVCHSLPSRVSMDARNDHVDWSVGIVDSTLERYTPYTFEGWQYFTGFYLLGQYEVYKRTGEERYLDFIQQWADRWIDDQGNLNVEIHSLDFMQAANVFLLLHEETKDSKYRQAASHVRNLLDDYPRTQDGGFWHAEDLPHQLWSDGVFMVNPFLIRYGAMFDESDYANDEAVRQLKVYGKHLQVDNGLLQHAYDESRQQDWSDPETGRSEEQWCRAMGWYGLTMMDVLDVLPEEHHGRGDIIKRLERFAKGVVKYQDHRSGRWFQVVNKGYEEENWTETSCSAMFTYVLSRSLEKGYLKDRGLSAAVSRGASGVLERIGKNDEGLTDVQEICIGTGVGNLSFYFNRPRATNDLHGLGAVLLMLEQVNHGRDK